MNERVAQSFADEAEDRAIAAEDAFEYFMEALSNDDIDACAKGAVPAEWYAHPALYRFARNIWALAYEQTP